MPATAKTVSTPSDTRATYRGEYVPGLSKTIAAVYGEEDQRIIDIAAKVVVGFDKFARTIDSVTDREPHDIGQLHYGALALIESYKLAGSVVPDMARFTDLAARYCREASAAELELQQRHRGKVNEFHEGDLALLGDKNAILKVALAFYDSRTGRHIYGTVERFMGAASVAVQIVDDVCDWREDLRAGNFTYPLTFVAQSGVDLTNEDAVGKALFSDKIAEEAVLTAENYLRECTRIIMPHHDVPSLHETLNEMRRSLHQARLCLTGMPTGTDPDEALILFKDRLIPMLNYF